MTSSGSFTERRKLKRKRKEPKKKRSHELPLDVLNLIAKKLDIDDLFSFGQVCKNWRTSYSDYFWRNFMACPAPLIVQKTPFAKRACFFYSISDGRTYSTLLPNFSGFSFAGFSSGYMVMVGPHSDMLINPFERKRIKIPKPQHIACLKDSLEQAILAFDGNSPQDFILVVFSQWKFNMYVYESRNSNWAIYSRCGTPWKVRSVGVFHNTLYAITEEAEIAVVMLNPRRLKFLQLINKPRFCSSDFSLVSSDDDQLLVVHFVSPHVEIYRIDFSTMAWIKLNTLGDRALFMSMQSKCYLLSNPGKWGFNNNHTYRICGCDSCDVVSMAQKFHIKNMLIPENGAPPKAKICNIDWCFRPFREVVDYSNLIES